MSYLGEAVQAFTEAMQEVFDPSIPPLGGGNTVVRFIAGSTVALELWDAHADGCACAEPFLWVRLVRIYRSKVFPAEIVDGNNCGLPEVAQIEIGVGRCASLGNSDGTVVWDEIESEAVVSLDDSQRISRALCLARAKLDETSVAVGSIVPSGPDGGVIAWAGIAFVQL